MKVGKLIAFLNENTVDNDSGVFVIQRTDMIEDGMIVEKVFSVCGSTPTVDGLYIMVE